jgi:hypothetical protein
MPQTPLSRKAETRKAISSMQITRQTAFIVREMPLPVNIAGQGHTVMLRLHDLYKNLKK